MKIETPEFTDWKNEAVAPARFPSVICVQKMPCNTRSQRWRKLLAPDHRIAIVERHPGQFEIGVRDALWALLESRIIDIHM